DEGFIIYNINITEELPLYLYFDAPHRQGAELFVNGEQRDVYFTENHWNILYAGTYRRGETVEIRLRLLDDEITVTDACFYYEDREALSEWYERALELNEGLGEINRLTSSHLKLDTTAGIDKRIVMSIPYDKGWRVTCDGVKLKTEPAMQVLLSYEIPSGANVIEMKYTPHGTVAGLITSIAGLIMFGVLCFKVYGREK
ncbi:MAG: YfhO family protein, partial [Lachnospiraceae bacterium]|nr:YfhO family protein [Lachnospiraceae bacterium]